MAEFENVVESGPSDFNEYEEEQVAELEDTDDWGELKFTSGRLIRF